MKIFLIFETIFLIVYVYKTTKRTRQDQRDEFNNQENSWSVDYVRMQTNWSMEFENLCNLTGAEKQTFQKLYGTHLGPIKNQAVNFLEIGLGCGTHYSEGKSLALWRKYMPNAIITIIEHNDTCAEPFHSQVESLFVGDQSNFKFLERVGINAGQFDFIVDDGGHTRKQQIHSLLGLWPYLKSGGVYVIEDMFFSYWKDHSDYGESSVDVVHKLIMLQNDALLKGEHMIPVDEHQFSPRLKSLYDSLESIQCYYIACAFVKK